MSRIRIFISSPGDLPSERLRADLVVDKLSQDFSRFFEIESYRWEHEAMIASQHFQDAIELPSAFDVVVLILWSRLGTSLPAKTEVRAYQGIDGRTPVTGTEWEYEEALKSARARGAPDLLAFRNVSQAPVDPRNPDAQIVQLNALNDFWRRHFADRGVFKIAYYEFETLDEFAGKLERSLRKLIERRVQKRGAAGPAAVIWLEDPFRGLQSYDFFHAPIFFGRVGLVTKAIERLAGNAAHGVGAFLMVSGASGSGKSSLVKAAMVPRLMKPQRVTGLAFLRRVLMRPAEAGADLVLGLAQALTRRDQEDDRVGLPELLGPGQNVLKLAEHLRGAAEAPGYLFVGALGRLTEAAQQDGHILRYESARLILIVDQLEEIFTESGIEAAERAIFVKLLFGLATSGVVWVVTTLRSDFWHRVEDLPVLVQLSEDLGRLDVSAPSHAEVSEIISKPAQVAGLSFEIDPLTNIPLDRVIAEDAAAAPGVLPLLSFALDELYKQARRDKSYELTYRQYESLGRLEGAITTRADATVGSLPSAAQAAMPRVLRALVTAPGGARETLVSRPAPQSNFADGTPARMLVDALIAARLLVATTEKRVATVRLTHEALITRWQRANDQLKNDRRDLETRTLLEAQFERWNKAVGPAGHQLLLRDPDLANAVALAERWGDELDPGLRRFIARSRLQSQLRLIVAAAAAVLFAAVALFAYLAAERAIGAQKQTEIALELAHSQSDLREGRIRSALESAVSAFSRQPSSETRSALFAGLMQISPHLVNHLYIGAQYAQGLAWSGSDTLVYSASGGEVALFDLPGRDPSTILHKLTQPVDGNTPSIPLVHSIGGDRLMALLQDGSIATFSLSGSDLQIRKPLSPIQVSERGVAISSDGSRVAVSSEQDARLFECRFASGKPECAERSLVDAPVTAAAFDPAGDRVALATDSVVNRMTLAGAASTIQIQSMTKTIASTSLAPGFSVQSLAWHPTRNWLAAGGDGGRIVVFDLTSGHLIAGPLGKWPVTALAWSPKGDQLAFVCEEMVACVASVSDDGKSDRTENVLRLVGHPGRVSRLAFSPDSSHLASADDAGEIVVWSINPDRRVSFDLTVNDGTQPGVIAYGTADHRLAAAYPEGISIWDSADRLTIEPFRTVAEAKRLRGASSTAQALAWSSAGELAAGYPSGAITLWSRDQTQAPKLGRLTPLAEQLAFVGNDLAVLSEDNQIRLFDPAHPDSTVLIDPRSEPSARSFTIDPERNLLFASHEGGEISRWELEARAPAGSLSATDKVAALGMSASPDGRFLAATGGQPFLNIFSLAAGKLLTRLPLTLEVGGQETAGNVAFSPDGHLLAALGGSDRIYIWQVGETFTPFVVVGSEVTADRVRRTGTSGFYNARLAWLGPSALATITGGGAVRVFNLDTVGWHTRLAKLYRQAGNDKMRLDHIKP
jgi:WD40 repeat protein